MKSLVALLSVVVAVSVSSPALAGTVYFTGDVGFGPPGVGTINVVFDLDPGDSFQNGGAAFSVVHDNLAAIQFTEATVLNPSGRWTIASAMVSPDRVDFNTSSFASPALPTGGQGVLFATIKFMATAYSLTNLGYDVGDEALVHLGDVVTQNYQFLPNAIFNDPEPSSLVLASLGLGAALMRRRDSIA